MKANDFRRIALSMPDAVEASHMGHPDFRVRGKVFATLGWPDTSFAMVKLTPEQQTMLVEAEPKVFAPVPGGWGRSGSTNVRLAAADAATLKRAIAMAWENVAPRLLVKRAGAARAPTEGRRSVASARDVRRTFARVHAALKSAKLPEVKEGLSYGTPSLNVRGKFLMRVKDADTLVFRCAIEEKALLIEAAPKIYFETDHYVGWPAVLVRASKVSDVELAHCLERAWRLQAPAKLVKQREEKPRARTKSTARRRK
jgi:hypothetical protein